MPRSNREYLLRYADQAINDLDRALEKLLQLSLAYAGIISPMLGDVDIKEDLAKEDPSDPHTKYQRYIELQASLILTAKENIELFKKQYM